MNSSTFQLQKVALLMLLRWITPAAIFCNEFIRLFGSPATSLVRDGPSVGRKYRINDCPGSFHGIFAGKERAIPEHGILQQPLIRRMLARLLFNNIELF